MDNHTKIAMEAHAFGVAAALGDMGMDQETALNVAVDEAKIAAAAGTLTRIGKGVADVARGAGRKAKGLANVPITKARGAAESAAAKARGAGSKAKDISGKVMSKMKSNPVKSLAGGAALGAGAGAAAQRAYSDNQ